MEREKLSDVRGDVEEERMRSNDHGPVNGHTVLAICRRQPLDCKIARNSDPLRVDFASNSDPS
jgi:hypothetical protein